MKVSRMLAKLGGELYTIQPDSTVADCVKSLNDLHIGALVVVGSDGSLQGIVSERDVLRKAFSADGTAFDCKILVEQIMRPTPEMPTATLNTHLHDVMKSMSENRTRHMVIVDDDGRAVGLVSVRDIVEELLKVSTKENEELQNFMYSW